MDVRSSFLLGKYVFIKIINLNTEIVQELKNSLQTGNYLPFETNEMIANYLLSGVSFGPSKDIKILTPNTKVLVSSNSYTLNDLNKYSLETYDATLKDLYNNFVNFNPNFNNNISTVILLSRKVDGNLESFLRLYGPNEKEIADALIHLSYIYFVFSKQYSMLHIDPKINNYTWQKLDQPIDITYDFSNNVKIVRKSVSHLFYLTDLEFVYSPIVQTKTIDNNKVYFNFSKQYEWLRDDRENVTFGPRSTLIEDQKRGNHLIIVPKISSEPYYDYNVNLFLGINGFSEKSNKTPRMFVIDILVLVKMILTYDYISYLPASISRILHKYFALFCALSKEEEENRYSVDYNYVSSYSFATSLSSINT